MTDLVDQNDIVEKFSDLRRECQDLSARMAQLSSDLQEHELVIKNLQLLDGDRKCYRLVSLLNECKGLFA
jgi:chaperonin cofactor prefoldin